MWAGNSVQTNSRGNVEILYNLNTLQNLFAGGIGYFACRWNSTSSTYCWQARHVHKVGLHMFPQDSESNYWRQFDLKVTPTGQQQHCNSHASAYLEFIIEFSQMQTLSFTTTIGQMVESRCGYMRWCRKTKQDREVKQGIILVRGAHLEREFRRAALPTVREIFGARAFVTWPVNNRLVIENLRQHSQITIHYPLRPNC